jgi:hypothetical protein
MTALPSVMPTCPPTFHNTIDVWSSAAAGRAATDSRMAKINTRPMAPFIYTPLLRSVS